MRVKSAIVLLLIFSTFSLNAQSREAYTKGIEKAGDYIQFALPTAALVASMFEEKGEESTCFLKSFLSTVAITHTMKYLIRKRRPNSDHEFNSMPSGHTSASFHAAAFIQMHYGWNYGIPAYSLAAFVGYSRIDGYNTRHDIWDVLAGATIGIATSYYFYKDDYKKLQIQSDFANRGVSVNYSF